jgi:hypothetical protein
MPFEAAPDGDEEDPAQCDQVAPAHDGTVDPTVVTWTSVVACTGAARPVEGP